MDKYKKYSKIIKNPYEKINSSMEEPFSLSIKYQKEIINKQNKILDDFLKEYMEITGMKKEEIKDRLSWNNDMTVITDNKLHIDILKKKENEIEYQKKYGATIKTNILLIDLEEVKKLVKLLE